jgi:hypothetical protein
MERFNSIHLQRIAERYNESTEDEVSDALEALPIEALPVEALPVDTNEPIDIAESVTHYLAKYAFALETDEHNQQAISLTSNVTEPLAGTSTVNNCFTGGSILKPLLITTPTLPPSIPATGFGQFHAF